MGLPPDRACRHHRLGLYRAHNFHTFSGAGFQGGSGEGLVLGLLALVHDLQEASFQFSLQLHHSEIFLVPCGVSPPHLFWHHFSQSHDLASYQVYCPEVWYLELSSDSGFFPEAFRQASSALQSLCRMTLRWGSCSRWTPRTRRSSRCWLLTDEGGRGSPAGGGGRISGSHCAGGP